MIEFRHDEKGYFAWIGANSCGFVLNVRGIPDADYVVLHRAGCGSISNRSHVPDAFTGRGTERFVQRNLEELRAAAKQEGRNDGSFPKRCGLCRP